MEDPFPVYSRAEMPGYEGSIAGGTNTAGTRVLVPEYGVRGYKGTGVQG